MDDKEVGLMKLKPKDLTEVLKDEKTAIHCHTLEERQNLLEELAMFTPLGFCIDDYTDFLYVYIATNRYERRQEIHCCHYDPSPGRSVVDYRDLEIVRDPPPSWDDLVGLFGT